MRKKLQDLTIKDAFMFAAVMSDTEKCRRLLELVLGMKILEVQVIPEKTISYHSEYHGVRLDVLAEEVEMKRRFCVKMQVRKESALAKRSRYYHAQMDMDALLAGESYDQLPDTYVIFICDFDPIGAGLYRYRIQNMVQEINKPLKDGNKTIFLSTKGTNEADVPAELVQFLQYVGHPENSIKTENSFVRDLQNQVEAIKRNREWEGKYMLLEEMMREERQEGRQQGRLEGQERINQLNALLLQQNRIEDVVKATGDSKYQEKLFKEFNL